MKKMLSVFIFILITLTSNHVFSGDYTPLGRRSDSSPTIGNPDLFLESKYANYLNQDQKDCVRDRTIFDKLCLGMPGYGVYAVLGLPDKRKESMISGMTKEMLIYKSRSSSPIYVFLENNKLTGWDK